MRRDTAVELARRHGAAEPPPYRYSDLAGFFAIYFPVAALMRDAADFERVIVEHAIEMARQGITYAEVSFNPSLHPGDAWLDGVERGRRRAAAEHRVEVAWLVELVRGGDDAANSRALEIALATPGVVGLGLVGDEAADAAPVAGLVERARADGLRLMAHAGQTGGPEVVREAVTVLRADRIAHGVTAVHDGDLCSLLARRDTCLCVCPTSNANIGLRPDYVALAHREIPLCVNTDDPGIAGTKFERELENAVMLGLERASLLAAAQRHRFIRG